MDNSNISPTLRKVKRTNQADPTAGGSSSTGSTLEVPCKLWQSTRPAVAPEPPAVPITVETIYRAQRRSFEGPPNLPADPEVYAAALELVAEIDAALTVGRGQAVNPSCHYRSGGRLLNTLDEVIDAILTDALEVT